MRMILIALGSVLFATGAQASTPAEWNAMNKRVNRACVAMSGLARPQPLAKTTSFSDPIGVEVRQLRGLDRQGRMKRLLCAYNRSSGRAEVQDGGVWTGPTATP